MIDDKDIEKFVEEESTKQKIDQSDKIDPSVEEHLRQMGWLFDVVNKKLEADKTCYKCKKEIDFSKGEKLNLLEANTKDKGIIMFVSLCESCSKEYEKKDGVKKNE